MQVSHEEQKVQFTESVRLAKEYAMHLLVKEDNTIDLESVKEEISEMLLKKSPSNEELRKLRKKEIQKNRIEIALQEIEYQLTEMKIAMDYRMKEVKSWEKLKEILIERMKDLGLSEEQIYNKEFGELEGYFYLFINNLKGLEKSNLPVYHPDFQKGRLVFSHQRRLKVHYYYLF